MRALRALLVDDEPLSRRALRQLLREEANVEIIAECGDATDAATYVDQVDVIFLDVEMPGASGLAFARSLVRVPRPSIVFVSAHEQYAFPAFDIEALDYLTKPVEASRLARTLARVRTLHALRRTTRLIARVGLRDVVVPVSDVVAIEADGVYVTLHADRRYLVRRALTELEEELEADFVRVHRSWLVRRDRVREVRPGRAGGGRQLVLTTGLVVPVSRRRAAGIATRVAE
jgi:two-component system, LytTR family, response regulator